MDRAFGPARGASISMTKTCRRERRHGEGTIALAHSRHNRGRPPAIAMQFSKDRRTGAVEKNRDRARTGSQRQLHLNHRPLPYIQTLVFFRQDATISSLGICCTGSLNPPGLLLGTGPREQGTWAEMAHIKDGDSGHKSLAFAIGSMVRAWRIIFCKPPCGGE
jgi:hypothetical protein